MTTALAGAIVAALLAAGTAVWFSLRCWQRSGGDPAWFAAAAGLALSTLVASLDGQGVLRWRFGLDTANGRLELAGAAWLLGLTLLAALAGSLLLAADAATRPSAAETRLASILGRRALLLALGCGVLALGVIVVETEPFRAARPTVVAVGLGVGLVLLGALALLANAPASADLAARAERWSSRAAGAAFLVLAAGGLVSWLATGTYATPPVAAAAAVAAIGLAAAQPVRGALALRVALLLGLGSLLA